MKHANKMFSAFVALLMMLLLTGQSISAPDSKGTDFWLMFNSNLGTPDLTIFITNSKERRSVRNLYEKKR